jgi:dihydrolipoamide dehydrogenase
MRGRRGASWPSSTTWSSWAPGLADMSRRYAQRNWDCAPRIEQKYWGGVCLNVGCVPSKALLRNADLVHILAARAKQFGIRGKPTMDYGAAFDRSRANADDRVKGVHYLMTKNNITEYNGKGTFTGPHTIAVEDASGGIQTVTFRHAIISTGAIAKLLPGTAITKHVVTYEEQITRRELPGSLLIIGAVQSGWSSHI